MTEEDKEFVELLFNLGILAGSLTRKELFERMTKAMTDKADGERLTGYMQSLHNQLGRLLTVSSMKGADDGSA